MTEIENRKHFNEILVSLKTVSDILRNIDQLCASSHSNMHMLRNSIRLKAPEIHQAFTDYISIFKLAKTGTKPAIIPFAEWAISKKLIPIKVIEAARNGKNIKPFSELIVARKALIEDIKKGKLLNTNIAYKDDFIVCGRCDKKFPSTPSNIFADHKCFKPKERKTVWIISGGGANGIRNRR